MSSGSTERESGFTLIEMLVALAIFSLAALALLRLGGATATNSASLSDQAIAQLVARNLAVETMTDPLPPAFGASRGTRSMAAAAGGGRGRSAARRKRASSRSRSSSSPKRAGRAAPT